MIPFSELPRHSVSQLFSKEEVGQRVHEIAHEIREANNGLSVVLLGVLTGASKFTLDLGESLWAIGVHDTVVDFIGLESYGMGMTSNRQPKVTKFPKLSVKDQNIHLVEDIVDSGYSLAAAIDLLYGMGAKKVKTVALLSKQERREVEVALDHLGFEIPNVFVVGNGIDWSEHYRSYPGIGVVEIQE